LVLDPVAQCVYEFGGTDTILGNQPSTAPDARTLALSALGWTLSDEQRAARLLDLTGLTPDRLKAGLDDPAVLGAVLDFLCAHEPDLIAAAGALDVEPAVLAAAARRLGA
jgi:hypothetical protein